jgi:hypothetical protein
MLFIGPIVRLMGLAEYFSVVEWVPWLAGAYVIGCLWIYFGNGMLLANRTDLMTIPAGAQLAALTITGILLVPEFQLAGVVGTRYAGAIVLFLSSLYLSRRVFRIEHRWGVLVGLAGTLIMFAAFGAMLTASAAIFEMIARAVIWAIALLVAWSIVVGRKRVNLARPSVGPCR